MAKRARPGRALEALIASLEGVLTHNEMVQIESPARLPDRVTGESREHDVLLKIATAHYKSTIAIECRDRSRKITVNDVEGFHAKCQDTGVSQGVIVSRLGFTRAAAAKAHHLGMRTLNLSDIQAFSWLGTSEITGHVRRMKDVGWLFEPDPVVDPLPQVFTVLKPDGVTVQPEDLLSAARAEFQKIPYDKTPPPSGKCVVIFPQPGLLIRDDITAVTHVVGRAIVEIIYEVDVQFSPFRLVKYADQADGSTIANAAIADVKLGNLDGKLVFTYDEKQGGTISFARPPRSEV